MGQGLKLALVGRPNVGKSALFNRLCNKKIAIVDEAEGVTRDRLYAEADFFGQIFQVIDTGGIDPRSKVPFQEEIRRQSEIAIEEADTLVMVVDARIGVTALDEEVAKILLRANKPVCVAVNKVDDFAQQNLIHQFYALGISKIIPVSAAQGTHMAELLEAAFEGLTFPEKINDANQPIRIAIVGRPNVGKSTLVNFLMQEERCVVSPIAGTTRDSIDVDFIYDGVSYTLIDTAGIRRKHAEHEVVDKFAAIRTERAIERADICILMVEAQSGLTTQEKGIARQIEESGNGCVILFNKWDLIKGFRMEHCLKTIREQVPFLSHCPALFVSAKTGRNLKDLFSMVKGIHDQQTRRVTTGQLNKFIERVMQKYHPPMLQGKRLRIYYMAQVDVHPPRFVLFVNNPELMCETYKKYLMNQFREEYQFAGVPLLFTLKGRRTKDTSPDTVMLPAKKNEEIEEEEGEELVLEYSCDED